MATDLKLLMRCSRTIRGARGVSRFWFASITTVVLAFSVGTATGPAVGQPATLGEPDSATDFQVRIEGVQHPSRQGLDVLTIEEVMKRFGVPGMGVAVIRNFEVHWAKGYGIADVETGIPVDDETLFQAASISKPVTAMAALVAVQDGRFSLDDDINAILTSWRLPGNGVTEARPVTPRLLFSHTAGLGDGHGFPGYEPDAPRPTPVQILRGDAPSNVGPVTMVRTPLTAMHYSGGGTTIMQLALTDVFGEPFPEIMRKSVLEPTGMTHSTFLQPLPPALDENAARGHSGDGKPMGDAKWHVYSAMAAAGLWTNARDLARFAIEVQRAAGGDPGKGAHRLVGGGDAESGRRRTVRGWLSGRTHGRRVVLQSLRQQLGLRLRPDRAQGEGLRPRRNDQLFQRLGSVPGGAGASAARVRVGCAGQARTAVTGSQGPGVYARPPRDFRTPVRGAGTAALAGTSNVGRRRGCANVPSVSNLSPSTCSDLGFTCSGIVAGEQLAVELFEQLDGVGGSRARLPPANPWPASPHQHASRVVPTPRRSRSRAPGWLLDYTTTRGGWERKELRMKDIIALLNDKRSELLDSVARIDAAIAALSVTPRPSASSRQPAKRRRREMSAEAKQAVSDRMKNYWAERRTQAETTSSGGAENTDDVPTGA